MDLIHDRWFDLNQVKYDAAQHKVTFEFGEKKNGPFDQELTIKAVTGYQIDDEAHIQIYDINEVQIDPSTRLITITSSFPLTIEIQVEDNWEIIIASSAESGKNNSSE